MTEPTTRKPREIRPCIIQKGKAGGIWEDVYTMPDGDTAKAEKKRDELASDGDVMRIVRVCSAPVKASVESVPKKTFEKC